MFNSKRKGDNYNSQTNDYSLNLIGSGTLISGDINCVNDIRVDGHIKGNISSKSRILVGENGIVEGEIFCQNAEISGFVAGNLKIKDNVVLKPTCKVQGDILTKTIVIESGALFAGNCKMETKDMFLLNESSEKNQDSKVVEKTAV